MKFLSCKEITAIVEIIVGALSLWNYYVMDIYDEKLQDVDIFKHRCMNLSLCFVSFFYAFGTWFWFSHIRMTKMLNRFHTVLVYFILNILLLYTHFSYKAKYRPLIFDHFDDDIFFDEASRMSKNTIISVCIFVLSLVIIALHMRYLIFRVLRIKKKKNNVRR